MKIKAPDGNIYDLDDCEIVTEISEDQSKLAEELFEKTGILIAGKKGGEIII